jgi:hypothetical protein
LNVSGQILPAGNPSEFFEPSILAKNHNILNNNRLPTGQILARHWPKLANTGPEVANPGRTLPKLANH